MRQGFAFTNWLTMHDAIPEVRARRQTLRAEHRKNLRAALPRSMWGKLTAFEMISRTQGKFEGMKLLWELKQLSESIHDDTVTRHLAPYAYKHSDPSKRGGIDEDFCQYLDRKGEPLSWPSRKRLTWYEALKNKDLSGKVRTKLWRVRVLVRGEDYKMLRLWESIARA
jgi:hypothetical protein